MALLDEPKFRTILKDLLNLGFDDAVLAPELFDDLLQPDDPLDPHRRILRENQKRKQEKRRPYATVTSGHRYTSWMAWNSSTPSCSGRWKALRPEIRPQPPARLLTTAVRTACARSSDPFDSPPELIRPTRPM